MKTSANLAKSAAVGLALIAIGLGVQYLNARANEAGVGTSYNETPTISPLKMMGSAGQLPPTVVDHYI